mmetsp:Transcript_23570/g.67385  ORF Transcript_23570/g.67385 Transcript_23570/m.67385 type:complete len:370 (+) Transcript_23570:73-1182(+)
MKHLDSGFEPGELSISLVKDHKAEGYVRVNAPPTPTPFKTWRKAAKPWWFVPLEVLTFTSLWWIAAILAIMQIKRTVSAQGIFPYPFALTAAVQMTTGLLAHLLSKAVYLGKPQQKRPPLLRHEVLRLLLLGGIQGFEIGLTNKALEYLTVSGRTLISSMNVFLMMCTSWVWGLERLGTLRLVSAALLVGGGVVQGLDGSEAGRPQQLLGAAMQVTSMIISSQRWALAQFVLQRSPKESALGQITKLQLLARTLPLTGLVCVPLSMMFEPGCCTLEELSNPDLAVPAFTVSVGLTAMLYAELKLVKRLSAVAFNVLATVHQIPIVLAGVVMRHEQVGFLSRCGFGLCLVGALVYAAARQEDRKLAGECS